MIIKIGTIFIVIPPPYNCNRGYENRESYKGVGRPTVDSPGRQPWKISLKTCNYVTLACKRGKARKLKTQSLIFNLI